ncbi:hypothetical protein B5P22_31085 [Pseudomonas tolaasii]|nr:hypothetical protein B5P22_31085 [Pseudomonas tolaasii]
MARTIRNTPSNPFHRKCVKRDAIGAERRQSKRSNWIGPCDTVTAPEELYVMNSPMGGMEGEYGWL